MGREDKKPLIGSNYRYREEDPDYRGEPLERTYGEGPEEKRECTDVFCLLIFFVFLAGLGYIASVAFKTGNPEYLVYPFDSDGKQCKLDPGYEDYPYIFISYKLAAITEKVFVCVKECPLASNSTIDCKAGTFVQDCNTELDIYATKPLATYCFPVDQGQKVVDQFVTDILNIAPLQGYFADVYVAWPLILSMIGVSFVVSIFYSVLIRYFAACMVWTMIFVLMLLLFAIGVVSALLPTTDFLKNLFHYD